MRMLTCLQNKVSMFIVGPNLGPSDRFGFRHLDLAQGRGKVLRPGGNGGMQGRFPTSGGMFHMNRPCKNITREF